MTRGDIFLKRPFRERAFAIHHWYFHLNLRPLAAPPAPRETVLATPKLIDLFGKFGRAAGRRGAVAMASILDETRRFKKSGPPGGKLRPSGTCRGRDDHR
jgi:hypothetical protein